MGVLIRENHEIIKETKKRLIGISELSRLLGLSINTLYSWVSQKRIPYVKCGRLTKFDLIEIEKWIKENSVADENVVDKNIL